MKEDLNLGNLSAKVDNSIYSPYKEGELFTTCPCCGEKLYSGYVMWYIRKYKIAKYNEHWVFCNNKELAKIPGVGKFLKKDLTYTPFCSIKCIRKCLDVIDAQNLDTQYDRGSHRGVIRSNKDINEWE